MIGENTKPFFFFVENCKAKTSATEARLFTDEERIYGAIIF